MNKLTGKGRPTAYTRGLVGQYYEDLLTGDIYECRVASEFSKLHGAPVPGYQWQLRATGEDIQEYADLYGSSAGGGVSSWNDLKDKPFGVETVENPLVITRDMILAATEVINLGDMQLRKISDEVYSEADLIGATLYSVYDGETNTEVGSVDTVVDMSGYGMPAINFAELVYIFYDSMQYPTDEGEVSITPGLWITERTEAYVDSMVFPSEVIKTIDPKYVTGFVTTKELSTVSNQINGFGNQIEYVIDDLKVVERYIIQTQGTADPSEMTAMVGTHADALSAFDAGRPIVLKIVLSGQVIYLPMASLDTGSAIFLFVGYDINGDKMQIYWFSDGTFSASKNGQ